MISMIEKKYTNEEMNIELTSFLDSKQNVWFRGKHIAEILTMLSQGTYPQKTK